MITIISSVMSNSLNNGGRKLISHLIIKYDGYPLRILVTDKSMKWFDAFMGVGYEFYNVRAKVILVFNNRKTLLNAWNKVIKWWPDDWIKMRFLETDHSYDFILYGESNFLENTWVFLKALKVSDHYKTFKTDYEGAAYLHLALYRQKGESYELELFDYRKKVSDVMFLNEPLEEPQDSIILRSKNIIHGLNPNHFEEQNINQ